jgi:hypothetical protein
VFTHGRYNWYVLRNTDLCTSQTGKLMSDISKVSGDNNTKTSVSHISKKAINNVTFVNTASVVWWDCLMGQKKTGPPAVP